MKDLGKAETAAEAEEVAAWIGAFMAQLSNEAGYSPAAVMAGAHAQIMTVMAATLGGSAAAERCENAADRVRNLPSAADVALANAVPAGRA